MVAVVASIAVARSVGEGGAPNTSSPCGPVERPPRELGLDRTRQLTLCLLNAERGERSLPALRREGRLELASQRHSEDMVTRRFFDHDNPDGADPQARMRAAGYASGNAFTGENIAWATGPAASPAEIVRLWMNSPPHRKDILQPGFVEIGLGVAPGAPKAPRSSDPPYTYTTDFGGPPLR
jgi:uncharacterized protein YkwD